jgi:hypothetical protein
MQGKLFGIPLVVFVLVGVIVAPILLGTFAVWHRVGQVQKSVDDFRTTYAYNQTKPEVTPSPEPSATPKAKKASKEATPSASN